MNEIVSVRALEELRDDVVMEDDRDARVRAFVNWGVRWLVQYAVEMKDENGPLSGDRREQARADAIPRLAAHIGRVWLDRIAHVDQVTETGERMVFTMLAGHPELGDAPDAQVIPLRPRS